ncbi:hypothetical protein, partial [Raoultella terrigena]|uniref:hypothetical protein n=1 Tax=Raoultella terrigena TaxID=577 RepID=UPI001C701D66
MGGRDVYLLNDTGSILNISYRRADTDKSPLGERSAADALLVGQRLAAVFLGLATLGHGQADA